MNPSVRAKVNWCRLARVASNRGSSIDGQVVHWHNLPLHLSEEIGMPTRNVVLTNYQASFVERLVSTGRYQNASEVLREGLRMVEQREAEDALRLEALRNAVRVGIADMEQGRYATFESGAQLRGHLASVATKAIAGA
jgi:antitoxin ParD1/3/4